MMLTVIRPRSLDMHSRNSPTTENSSSLMADGTCVCIQTPTASHCFLMPEIPPRLLTSEFFKYGMSKYVESILLVLHKRLLYFREDTRY